MEFRQQRIQSAISATQKGIFVNAILVVVKIVTGVVGSSYALIADGIESASDLLSSLIVWRGLEISKRDASDEYHFGYGRAETVAGAIVAIFLFAAAIGVFVAAIREIQTPHHLPAYFTLPILIVVIFVKEVLFRFISKVGSETESTAVQGDAWHHRSDALTSLAALIGITLALIGGPGWEPADDYAALFCAFVIGSTGYSLLRRSLAELMDKAPAESVIDQIRNAAASVEDVKLVEKVMARKSGVVYFVDLHIHADPKMSLYDAHILSGKVKTRIKRAIPAVQGVMVHMEPDQHSNL